MDQNLARDLTTTCTFAGGFVVQALSTLASLLGVTEAVLKSMLTQRVVTTRGEVFTKQLSVPDADLTRDAIVKSLYEVSKLCNEGTTGALGMKALDDTAC